MWEVREMSKLLRADFARLFKSKIFWLGTIFMFGFAVFAAHTHWKDMRDFPDYISPYDGMLFAGTEFIGIVIAIVIGIFIGTDYSHGTIRNKLAIGHSRMKIYFSNLIVCTAASMIMHFAWLGVIIGGAVSGLTRKFEMPAGTIAAEILISIFAVSAITAIFLLVSMLVPSRSAGVVAVMVLSLAMIISAMTIWSRLDEPEYFSAYDYVITDPDGTTHEIHEEMAKNPYYLEGTKRRVYEILYDIIPNCQIRHLALGDGFDDSMNLLPLYSFSIMIVTTAAGILIFRRKDLK